MHGEEGMHMLSFEILSKLPPLTISDAIIHPAWERMTPSSTCCIWMEPVDL
ncbi:Hypothetical protein SMAX5B_003393 [Scophthalmus maximus]|uniref:Uncharacterized protein n=1 Tax=Scophthalmus maximus TaxID=52904 RepID=A0A2U9CQ33_SCOMX|nr:Hypothetical protein SMAX5B_003393 [Scophthalmus maximus]